MIDSVPLIQNVAKDDINTSIIALKKEEKRLEQLIAEADAKIKELNELKVNVSDIVNEVTSGNMHSVTSGAVAESVENVLLANSFFNGKEVDTGRYWIYENEGIKSKIYTYTLIGTIGSLAQNTDHIIGNLPQQATRYLGAMGSLKIGNYAITGNYFSILLYNNQSVRLRQMWTGQATNATYYVMVFYTKD